MNDGNNNTSGSFEEQARALLKEFADINDSFGRELSTLAQDVDKKLAATDLALEEFTKELEKGEE